MFIIIVIKILAGCAPQAPLIPYVYNETENEPQNFTEPKHSVSIPRDLFIWSAENPRIRDFGDGRIIAGVVPHHDTAAVMISGFFSQAARFEYDTVIILAPNHSNDFAKIITSYRDWDIGVMTDRDFTEELLAADLPSALSHEHIENDHSVNILIPYIGYYLPDTKVAPVLLNRKLGLDEIIGLFNWLKDYTSDKNVLLVASIDFSHFLTAPLAAERDRATSAAIYARDFWRIHTMGDDYLDSPAALIIFLKYLDSLGIEPLITDRANSEDFLGRRLEELTTYKVIKGVCMK
jgi:hypothetical protein